MLLMLEDEASLIGGQEPARAELLSLRSMEV